MTKIILPMGKVLQKDIIIPAGTVFWQEPIELTRRYYGYDNFTHIIGLSDDSFGELTYCIDKDDPELSEWFKEYDPNKSGDGV